MTFYYIQGKCNRETGICKCRAGFEGAACDISELLLYWSIHLAHSTYVIITYLITVQCPVDTLTSSIPEGTNITAVCSGNGRCVSLRDVTNFQTFNTYLDYSHYAGFDADKVHGCVCEEGWGGIACEKRLCPKGDDPLASGISGSQKEIQLIDCLCTSCQGGLYISFKGQQTPMIPYDASEELIQFRISVREFIHYLAIRSLHHLIYCTVATAIFFAAGCPGEARDWWQNVQQTGIRHPGILIMHFSNNNLFWPEIICTCSPANLYRSHLSFPRALNRRFRWCAAEAWRARWPRTTSACAQKGSTVWSATVYFLSRQPAACRSAATEACATIVQASAAATTASLPAMVGIYSSFFLIAIIFIPVSRHIIARRI